MTANEYLQIISGLQAELEFYEKQLAALQAGCKHEGELYTCAPPICTKCGKRLHKDLCMDCEGCGWYEGGVHLMKRCKICDGTGFIGDWK